MARLSCEWRAPSDHVASRITGRRGDGSIDLRDNQDQPVSATIEMSPAFFHQERRCVLTNDLACAKRLEEQGFHPLLWPDVNFGIWMLLGPDPALSGKMGSPLASSQKTVTNCTSISGSSPCGDKPPTSSQPASR